MRRVEMPMHSLAEDAALTALVDIAHVIKDWGRARIVGGHMVHLHTLLADIEPRSRRTSDTDVAATISLIGSEQLATSLLGADGLGYERLDGSRIARPLGDNQQAVIDLMVPSQTSATRHNVRAGAFVVDAFPSLRTALHHEPQLVEIHATRSNGTASEPFVVAVPDLIGALVVKALASRDSARDRDIEDVDHLLRCAATTGVRLPLPSSENLDYEKAATYLHGPFLTGRSATTARRRLVQRVVPHDPRPDPFPYL